jgi:hypothetical protein
VLSDGLEQATRYAAQSSATEVHLIVCDERPDKKWDEKIYERSVRCGDVEVQVWGV